MAKSLGGRSVYSVSEIVKTLSSELASAFPDIWVEGEISGFKRAASGHLYLTLKDNSAALKTVIFRTYANRLPFEPENGMTVFARGKLSVYQAAGELQLYATFLEPSGLGALQMAFEQAKAALVAEGLTSTEHKRPVPPFPGRVGIVTSSHGAALWDVISVLERRGATFDLVVSPAMVQGDEAPNSIKRAMDRLRKVDGIEVVLLTRGGGSLQDLWAFNDESLARMVADYPIPVISAVGHEVDTVLTDLTADLRAPTPSVAAELLTQRTLESREFIQKAKDLLAGIIGNTLHSAGDRLDSARPEKVGALMLSRLENRQERCDRLEQDSIHLIRRRIESLDRHISELYSSLSPTDKLRDLSRSLERLSYLDTSLGRAMKVNMEYKMRRTAEAAKLLNSMSPLAVLDRGYSAAFDKNGKPVRECDALQTGDAISLAVADGDIDCRVEGKTGRFVPKALKDIRR